jgi:hypothetical protein
LIELSCATYSLPDEIHVEGGKFHVQGIAWDKKEKCLYCSFTSAFYKTDIQGNVIGSVNDINGHLGDITFNPDTRKAYASLEFKNDEIGKGIADALGAERHDDKKSRFCIVEIDVDKIQGQDTPFEDVAILHNVEEAAADYQTDVDIDGTILKHRYGCSGIDGISTGPEFGSSSKKVTCLYVAYGIYRDTLRKDNDYNIILCYDLKNPGILKNKYFVYTGNTTYGVQNMEYDPYTGYMYLAVYPGKKPQFPNFRLFALNMTQKPYSGRLKNVPYHYTDCLLLDVHEGWHFKWGSTGLWPLGDGRYYISHNGKDEKGQYCKAILYNNSKSEESPFEQAKVQ